MRLEFEKQQEREEEIRRRRYIELQKDKLAQY